MSIKLIGLDLDGTLFTGKKEILPSSMDVLNRVQAQGIKVAITTGRLFIDALMVGEKVSKDIILDAANGAYAYDAAAKTVIYEGPMNKEELRKIVDICRKYHTTPCLYHTTGEYIGQQCLDFMIGHGMDPAIRKIHPQKTSILIKEDAQWDALIEEDTLFYKAVCYDMNGEIMMHVRQELEDCQMFEVVSASLFPDSPGNIEVTKKGVSKGECLKRIGEYYGIGTDEMMVFGDSGNDASMFNVAKYAIAMGNAAEDIKALAYDITDDNEHDGIAKAVRKYIDLQ